MIARSSLSAKTHTTSQHNNTATTQPSTASVSAAISADGALLLDPDADEEAAARALFCFAFPYRHALLQQQDSGDGGGQQQQPGQQQQQQQQQQQGEQQQDLKQQQQQELVVDEGALTCHATGRFSAEQFARAADACRRGCRGVAQFCRLSLVAGFKDALAAA